jgi:hypothetical protein
MQNVGTSLSAGMCHRWSWSTEDGSSSHGYLGSTLKRATSLKYVGGYSHPGVICIATNELMVIPHVRTQKLTKDSGQLKNLTNHCDIPAANAKSMRPVDNKSGTHPFTKMSWCRMMASQILSAWSSWPFSFRMRSRATIAPLNSKDIFVVERKRSAVPMSCNRQAK